MNEPIERAQECTGKATARQLLNVVRMGRDSLSMHGRAVHDRPSYSDAFLFTVRATTKDRNKVETISEVEIPGYVGGGHTSEREEREYDGSHYMRCEKGYRPTTGFWYLAYNETLRNVLELLPSSAEVAFHVYLDAGTNEYLVRSDATMPHGTYHGMHSDQLYLIAWYMSRGKRIERRFLLDTQNGPHNTARFGRPYHEKDGTGNPIR